MRIDLLTREYPPFIYGGAGVHVNELAKVLRPMVDLRVLAFDGPRVEGEDGFEPGVIGYSDLPELEATNGAVKTLGVNLEMTEGMAGTDLLHAHTWYTTFAGYLGKLLFDVPLVISAHSLEPLRPWKAEQLGGGYCVSSFAEQVGYENADAIIAVSNGMRDDILKAYPAVDPDRVKVIHNGIDLAKWHRPDTTEAEATAEQARADLGIDPNRRTVAFVGRITRQKGLPGFLRAVEMLPEDVQVVLCAGAPDTPEIAAEVEELIEDLQKKRTGIVLITQMLPHDQLVAVLAGSDVFATPSIYEPLGIVNLEAMAIGLPVVGTKTGGIPDVIVDGETGYLVPIEQAQDGTGTPLNPRQFEADFAAALVRVLDDPEKAREMGQAGLERARDLFSWEAIGKQTVALYESLVKSEDS
ncbi:MAG: glycogen synthase [Scrofimicrobium sp.]